MEIGDKKAGLFATSTTGASEADEAERADEVQGQRRASGDREVPLGPLYLGARALESLAQPGKTNNVFNIVDLSQVGSDSTFRRGMQEKLVALAANDFGPEHQRAFARYLEQELHLPDDAPRLAWAKSKLWHLIRHAPDVDVRILSRFFEERGMHLLPWQKLPAGHPGFQVERASFRAALEEAEKRGGVLTRRIVMSLLDELRHTVDIEDLFWCQLQINRLIENGRLEFADQKTESLTKRFFDSRLCGRAGMKELGWALRRLRLSDFSPRRVASLCERVDICAHDPDALFYVERQLQRELRKGRRAAEKLPQTERERLLGRLEQARATLAPKLEVALEGHFDRYAAEKQIECMHRRGEIDARKLMALRAAVVTSRSHDDFIYGAMNADVQLAVVRAQAELADAWADLWEMFSRNMSDDELDAEGRIIRTAEERLLEQRRQERLIERLRVEPQKIEQLVVRAWLRGGRQRVLSALVNESDPSRRTALQSELAQRDIELGDLDPIPEPTS